MILTIVTILLAVALLGECIIGYRCIAKANNATRELESYKNRIERRVERIGLDVHNIMIKAHSLPERTEARIYAIDKKYKSIGSRLEKVESVIKRHYNGI